MAMFFTRTAATAAPQQHLFYRDAQGAIHHIFLDGVGKLLLHDQWTEKTDPPSAGDPAILATPGQQHVFYRDGQGVIRHVFFDESSNQLYQDNWTEKAGAPLAVGNPVTMVTLNQQHVFYRDVLGDIQHLFVNEKNQFFHDTWTQRKQTTKAAGDPVTLVTPNQQHIFFRDVDGDIQHIFVNEKGQFFSDVWTQRAQAQKAAGDPVVMLTDHQQHIFYRDVDGAIEHIFVNESNQIFNDRWTLPLRTGALAAMGNPATMLTPHQQHLFYRDTNGEINHVFFDDRKKAGTPLFRDNWTRDSGALAALGDPVAMLTDNQQHIFYRNSRGTISHIIADDRRKPGTPLFHDDWTQDPRRPWPPAHRLGC